MAKPKTKERFEDALKRLEEIVKDMDSDNLPLEDAIAKFEEGIKLSKLCSDRLDEAEKKIMVLMKDSAGEVKESPFEE